MSPSSNPQYPFRPPARLLGGLRELSRFTGRSVNDELSRAAALHLAKSVASYADPKSEAAKRAREDAERLERSTYGPKQVHDLVSSYEAPEVDM